MLISTKTKIAGVIGNPISHSLSPKLHNYLLEKYNINGIYIPFKIEKDDLKSSLESFVKIGFKGCNVTIPHKEKTLKICHSLSKSAIAIGAVNTVIVTEDKKLYGHNSDGEGFINNIKQNYSDFNFSNKRVVLLGAGGAARAICYSLIKEKVSSIIIINRNQIRAQNLINDFNYLAKSKNCRLTSIDWQEKNNILKDCDLLINTTSLGMEGQDELEINLENLPKNP